MLPGGLWTGGFDESRTLQEGLLPIKLENFPCICHLSLINSTTLYHIPSPLSLNNFKKPELCNSQTSLLSPLPSAYASQQTSSSSRSRLLPISPCWVTCVSTFPVIDRNLHRIAASLLHRIHRVCRNFAPRLPHAVHPGQRSLKGRLRRRPAQEVRGHRQLQHPVRCRRHWYARDLHNRAPMVHCSPLGLEVVL